MRQLGKKLLLAKRIILEINYKVKKPVYTVEPRLYQPRLYHKPRLKQQKGSDLISYLIKPPKNPDYITHFENEKPRLYHSFFWEK